VTVVVGIYCDNGIVIASDSALTINGVIEQSYPKKIACLEPNLVVGFAGDLGFAQRYRQVLTDIWNPQTIREIESIPTHKIINLFCIGGINEYLSTQQSGVQVNIPTSFIIGFAHNGEHKLIVLQNGAFQPVVINKNLPFVSVGSGSYITDTFLGFARKVFWQGQEIPSLPTGIFSAIMALNLAVDINSGGINAPIHVAVLQKNANGQYSCNKLNDDEVDQHQENCKAAINHFASYPHTFDRDTESVPEIPQLEVVTEPA
jgi:20S proteasome alpha/beta subunit